MMENLLHFESHSPINRQIIPVSCFSFSSFKKKERRRKNKKSWDIWEKVVGGGEEEDRNHQRSDDGTMEKGKETSNKKESRERK
jgi:hypothetical protein